MTYNQCISSYNANRALITKTVKLFASGEMDETLKINRNINFGNARRKVNVRTEAKIIEIACDPVPEGHTRWTIRLLEERMKVELDEPISKETIWHSLKKQLRPHHNNYWCLPNRADAEFVACIEDVLNAYELPICSQCSGCLYGRKTVSAIR